MKKQGSLLFLLMSFGSMFSQPWVEKMDKPGANFYDIKADFESYWSVNNHTEGGRGYKVFKRWENFVERRVYPSGDLSLLNQTAINYQRFLEDYNAQNKSGPGKPTGGTNLIASATFTPMGPFGAISGNAGGQFLRSGRLNFITINPTNPNNLWVGAPAGGLWKSTNGGTSWTTNTDLLPVIGCSDLAIDPTNTLVMYLGTGDGDAGDTRSVGVLKTTDGGLTWNTTGLTAPITNGFLIRRLIINPTNNQVLIAATNTGIYRTGNAGLSWTQVSPGSTYDVEFKPGNSLVVYAAGPTFKLSTDGGLTFTATTTGVPTTGINRMAIAVTNNDANYVYVLASLSSNSGFQGYYRSINSGATFTLMSSTPNILNNSGTGSGTGGQGWYDLCTAASPLNKDEVVVGGVNVWRSLDGGINWVLYGHWTGSGAPFTHADHHDLEYDALGNLFNTNDGTVYKHVGASWTEISGLMNISQIYKFGLSTVSANKWISGHQDNGTSIWTGASYNAALGGDGMDCFIDRTNDQNMFGEYQNGALRKSTNAGLSWVSCTGGLTGVPPWVTVWKQDPVVSSRLYVGYEEMFVSNNLAASSWTQTAALPAAGGIREFAIAPSNNQVIYVLKSAGIYKTTNGGLSWLSVTGTVPVGSGAPEFICIDPSDENNAWVVLSGYSSGNKVFMTSNGGASWTNFTGNLPNIPANCCIYQPGTNDRIYVGMDVGIYYRDAVSPSWTLYNTGLPNVPISDFEISPASPTLLHAATYGRGVWVASLFNSAPVPVSGFAVTSAPKCVNTTITFTDQSSFAPISWSWSVNPSAGVIINSPTSQNPAITFPNGGNYTVSMVATNTVGPGNMFNQVVSITGLPNITIANNSQAICSGATVTFVATGATSYTWSNGGGNAGFAFYTPASSTSYTVTGGVGGCTAFTVCNVTVNPPPVISISGQNAICFGNSAVLLANGAATYTWNTNATTPIITVTPSVTTVYTVTGKSGSGCLGTSNKTVTVLALPNVTVNGPNTVCFGGPAVLIGGGAFSYTWNNGTAMTSSITVNPIVSTVYSLTGMDANGCTNTTTKPIQVDPLPVINLMTNHLVVCISDVVEIKAFGALTYTWLPGAQTGSVLSFIAGSIVSYTCTGTDANGCSNSQLITFAVTECVILNESQMEANDLFSVFPNPSSGKLNIETKTANCTNFTVKLYDALGKLLITQEVKLNHGERETELDITRFPTGVYFLKLQNNNRDYFIRVIKAE